MDNKRLVIGILAHVDAGKTTLAEGILYRAGNIRSIGRVDHGNTFLDTFELERSRGITIFSKQAEVKLDHMSMTLLDTPGHVDFSAEMERTLQVLDYAILVISGSDGVQGHVQTLWRLLKHYQIPTFLFINKMDQDGTERDKILSDLRHRLDEKCIDFTDDFSDDFYESVAMCDEELLNIYLEEQYISDETLRAAIFKRNVFPCFFGSALKMDGIDKFLVGLQKYTEVINYQEEFGAKVYKITRDKQGIRLTHLKITGGSLKVKTLLKDDEKVDQIRIYSGSNYTTVNEVSSGSICAVTGLSSTKVGECLGINKNIIAPILEPVLSYCVELPDDCDAQTMYLKLKQLEEEEPELNVVWDSQLKEIHVKVMGDIQIEILQSLIKERYQTNVTFGEGNIVYKETIAEAVEGAGHYEPLRHYAEVRLLLEPTEKGSGLTFETNVSEDILERNWQRLILTHLAEKTHKGVLTGSDITDMKITLINGRAHLKHTEGGDFRQSTYRAVRQGLKKAKNILLEPIYEFELEIPSEYIGRAMADIQRMKGTFESPIVEDTTAILKGKAPVIHMRDYHRDVMAYTKGLGHLFCNLNGYEPCHNATEVIDKFNYNSENDIENPTGSVFCSHGAGFTVSWDKVEEYMHTESSVKKKQQQTQHIYKEIGSDEIDAILEKTFRANVKKDTITRKTVYSPNMELRKANKKDVLPEILLVDGYNIIFAWKNLKELAETNIDAARGKLIDMLCNFQGYRKNIVIIVFDGHKVVGNIGEVIKHHNIYVVYTKEAETADQYIEKTVHDIGNKYDVKVATSDALEQMIILGQGAMRMSANDLLEELRMANIQMNEEHMSKKGKINPYLFESLPENLIDFMDDVRLGRRKFEEINNLEKGDNNDNV